MIIPPKPPEESLRLKALDALKILNSPAEERFDRLTRIAQYCFNVPFALISLVDESRQWFKSVQGLEQKELPRDTSICGHCILSDEILYIPDISKDPRFFDNPLVVGPPHIKSYVGAPLRTPDGYKVGTLCIADSSVRKFTATDLQLLRELADCVEHEINDVDKASLYISQQTAFLKHILDAVVEGVLTTDVEGKILTINPGALTLFGYDSDELLGENLEVLLPENQRAQLQTYFEKTLQQRRKLGKVVGQPSALEIEGLKKGGETFTLELGISELKLKESNQLVCVVRDISNARAQQSFLNAIVENIPNMIFVKDAKNLAFTLFNRAGEELLGISRDEMIGKTDYDFFPKNQADNFVAKDRQVLKQNEPLDISEEPIETRHLGRRYLHTRKICVKDRNNQPLYLLGISEDITEKKLLAEELFKQATLDSLTKVKNRTSLYEFLGSEIKRAKRTNLRLACIYIDLDKFKPINDQFGHAIGDIVLVKIAERLSQYVRESDCIARIGGDEFVVVLTDLQDLQQIELFRQRITEDIKRSIGTPKGQFSVSLSMGVAICPDDGDEMETLLQKADQRMYINKKQNDPLH